MCRNLFSKTSLFLDFLVWIWSITFLKIDFSFSLFLRNRSRLLTEQFYKKKKIERFLLRKIYYLDPKLGSGCLLYTYTTSYVSSRPISLGPRSFIIIQRRYHRTEKPQKLSYPQPHTHPSIYSVGEDRLRGVKKRVNGSYPARTEVTLRFDSTTLFGFDTSVSFVQLHTWKSQEGEGPRRKEFWMRLTPHLLYDTGDKFPTLHKRTFTRIKPQKETQGLKGGLSRVV